MLNSLGLHWFFKTERDSKHKIPYPRTTASLYKQKGVVLAKLFNLVEGFFTFNDVVCDINSRYRVVSQRTLYNSCDFFALLVGDCMVQDMQKAIGEFKYDELPKYLIGRGKERVFNRERAFVETLRTRKLEQPIVMNTPINLGLYQFYSECRRLAEKYDQFNKKFWNPYLDALLNEVKYKYNSSQWCHGFIDNDRFVKQLKGRSKKCTFIVSGIV